MPEPVTVAIPVLNGRPSLDRVLEAVAAQQLDRPIELLVADSGSSDGSPELAQKHGARVIDIAPEDFSHGGTRRLLSERASGSHVAFLTQDAVPAHGHWLGALLHGFALAPDVALVFGPYRPRADASPMVKRELDDWFGSLSADGAPRLDRGLPSGTEADVMRRVFFTDANGCVLRSALERVPFRSVAYAEDQLLARDMLRAGYAKVFRPDAPVVHSHDFGARELFRRSFDEWRALREVHGVAASGGPVQSAMAVQRNVRDDLGYMRAMDAGKRELLRGLGSSGLHQGARAAGAMLGARADRLPPRLRARLSLEERAGFSPVEPAKDRE